MSQRQKKQRNTPKRQPLVEVTDADIDEAIAWTTAAAQSNATLHALFNTQVREMMDDAGLTEEEKQSVLVAMACPCCGSGNTSFTYKLRSKG